MAYQYENGRRYHAYEAGRYLIPNDDPEASRLDLQHRVWLLTLHGKLYRSPLDGARIKTALDIGSGTGIWAIDFAKQHTSCHVVGTDLSPVETTQVPPNCDFMVHDAESQQQWAFSNIGYIHSRFLISSIRDWPVYIQRCFDSLAPGGWLELQEGSFPPVCDDDTCPPDDPPDFMRFTSWVVEASARKGVYWNAQNKFLQYLEAVGFVNVKREEYKWPIGGWMGEESERLGLIGEYMISNATEFVNGSAAFFTRVLGWSSKDHEAFTTKCKTSLKSEAYTRHQYLPVTVHYAQKPLPQKESGGESIVATGEPMPAHGDEPPVKASTDASSLLA